MTQKLKFMFPFLFLILLLIILWRELFFSKPKELSSSLIGEPIPTFSLPSLYNPNQHLTEKNMSGQLALINVWATWCYACKLELPVLLKIKNEYHIPIYGIDYKDDQQSAISFLAENGNPYTAVGMDKSGDTAIDFGVYGTPETYVVNKSGKIVYKHIGVLDQESWDKILYPLIRKFSESP